MSESLVGAIRLPDGTAIRGRGRRDPLPSGPLPDFGLYLQGRSRAAPPSEPGWQPGWEAAWIDWPDFRIPRDKQLAAASIVDASNGPGPVNGSRSRAAAVPDGPAPSSPA